MVEIVVPVKAAPVGAAVARLDEMRRWAPSTEFRLDPINELTIAWSVRVRDAGAVTAVSIGGAEAEVALRAALSRGCTSALRIDPGDSVHADVASAATLLAGAAVQAGATVAAFGYESYDSSSGTLPAATAAALGWTLVSRARAARLQGATLEVTRSAGETWEMVDAPLPAVVSLVEGEIVAPHPSLAAVIATRRARIPVIAAAELLGDRPVATWTTGLAGIVPVPPRAPQTRVLGPEDGVRELRALVGGTDGN